MIGQIEQKKWSTIKGRLKQKYSNLTENDLLFAEGQEEALISQLQQKLGKNREEIERELEAQIWILSSR